MEKKKVNSPIKIDKAVGSIMMEGSEHAYNLGQVIVYTTEDKIRLCLLDFEKKRDRKQQWLTPLGICLTMLVTLVTTTFKEVIFPAATWEALFILGFITTCIWTIVWFLGRGNGMSIDSVVKTLKHKESEVFAGRDGKYILEIISKGKQDRN